MNDLMKLFLFLASLVLLDLFLSLPGLALPIGGVHEITSPDKRFCLKLVDTKEPWVYQLKLYHDRKLVSHYSYEGELLNARWSPSHECGH